MARVMSEDALVLLAAGAIDLVIGELPNALHPVAWFGRVARAVFDAVPRRGRAVPLLGGTLATVGLTLGAAYGAARLVSEARSVSPTLAFAVAVFLAQSTFALRGLVSAAREVLLRVRAGETDEARRGLAALCSRDPNELDTTQLITGATESLAENASDSVVAPLVAYVLFGLPGAVAYRCINTLDAMYGYRDDREWLGKFAARLDDVANLVPARLSALLLLVAGLALGCDGRRALAVYRRDRGATESPNGGHPMAMMAGLLGARLDKPGGYVLGGELPVADERALAAALRIVATAGCITVGIALLVTGLTHGR